MSLTENIAAGVAPAAAEACEPAIKTAAPLGHLWTLDALALAAAFLGAVLNSIITVVLYLS